MTATEPHVEQRLDATALDLIRHTAPRVTVIGDLILDGWWAGHSERISREAPAPVVDVAERRYSPGGAANTAMNLAALGAHVRLVGLVGDDDDADRLLGMLAEAGVDVSAVVRAEGARTTTKTRIVSDDHVLVRVDDGHHGPFPAEQLERLAEQVRAEQADAEIVCDYGFGTLHGPVMDALADPARQRPALLVVDAHDGAPWATLRPDIVTPNAAETARLLGVPELGSDRVAAVLDRRERLWEATGAATVAVTLDSEGSLVLDRAGAVHRTHAHPALDSRTSGAGDTYAAGLTVARASGLPLSVAAELAQVAADVVVQRYGTSICTLDDVAAEIGPQNDFAVDHDALEALLAAEREEGRRIVFTNGCFDVLHRGHTTYLAQARKLGDVLVVAINDDDSVRRLKGPDRPVNTAADRAGVLAALGCVDYVTQFDDDTPRALLERLRPDIYVKGGDYTPEMLSETEVVRGYGGEVRTLDYVPSHSTTEVIGRIRSTAPSETS
ncbi:D-glycero-beta-D-manno-heptose 1-phosphate adenylyltransferase [Salinibacterium sp. SYSU T00001]|uniref:D-glycero-beta-D-manno-heptose 1-phosphate adenylyltransferase n=1 Tax=Homoserinimonas sedimenticola TaxID=2986805 RepID=UPI0022360218|nr:D-glycero-beta-D-manno-heptose 1-phosphate adenylyltransferase [Salinibacterium sedimenticola]MCW4385601.1 D-glycero-beta-D-manno-heptose 1-phosphate adenylyltransferase [Salinibacterium sedimenticola]